MKSIKEKAEESSLGCDEVQAPAIGRGFVLGANYVLSILYDTAYKEDWIINPKDGIRRFFEIYRQLKK